MGLRAELRVASVLVLSCCASERNVPAPSSVPPVVSPAPVVRPAPDAAHVEISGQLRAHDGTNLREAEVAVHRGGMREPVVVTGLDGEGRFRVAVPPGVYHVSIAAVDHRRALRLTVVTEDLRVEGRLGTHDRAAPGETVAIRGELLDAAGKVVGDAPRSATRIAEHVYRLDLSSVPRGAVTLRYQLVTPGGGPTYNGPLADRYASDGGGDFWSIVDVGGKDALALDMRALPEPGRAPRLEWSGESPPAAALHGFRDRWRDPLEDVVRRMPREDGKLARMTDELRTEAVALAAKARSEVEAVAEPSTRALLRAEHLATFGLTFDLLDDGTALREEVGWIIEHLPPTDPHLALLRDFDRVLFRVRRDADDAFLARTEAWLARRARENPEQGPAIDALELLLDAAERRRDDARVAELYALVLDERFAGSSTQAYLRQRYDPDRILQRGRPFPAFDFAALDDEARRITSADRRGRVYLLEFWATWCAPCVAEMPKLHATYAAINGAKSGKGHGEAGLRRLAPAKRPQVEFVFVSLDADPATVAAFREQHWSMPWTHAFVGRSGETEVMARYGFSAVPTAVLVDETGTILELGESLRKDALRPTLERVLAGRKGHDPR